MSEGILKIVLFIYKKLHIMNEDSIVIYENQQLVNCKIYLIGICM